MTGNQSFYSFAAVLIPTLLLGGVLVDRWRPTSGATRERHWVLAPLVVGVLLFALEAEVQAINAAIVGNPTVLARAFVIIAVVGSTVAVVLTVAWPWLAVMGRHAQILVAVAALALAVSAFPLLDSAIKLNLVQHKNEVLERTQGKVEALLAKKLRDSEILLSQRLKVEKLLIARHHLDAKHVKEAEEITQIQVNLDNDTFKQLVEKETLTREE